MAAIENQDRWQRINFLQKCFIHFKNVRDKVRFKYVYKEYCVSLIFDPLTNQLKISTYESNHEKQVKFENSVIEDLTIGFGFPLSIVDKPGFHSFTKKECSSKLKLFNK
ncbi:hypothetical protein BpHYR1_012134 [Brachionus plicatilis]|uniref:Uncharacterized protein n=1 Tax=Brachionus plicatilis TaxID=10195 RepID=A0A3M7R1X2_BRAPC|nr:hypothetical protein BpHYR1_012134 [Brachionus plicatilis]